MQNHVILEKILQKSNMVCVCVCDKIVGFVRNTTITF